jgi:hypothetical protein
MGEMTSEQWRYSYGDLRNRESGAYEEWALRYPDEAKDLMREDSKDPNYRALSQYYAAFRDNRTSWGELDSEGLDATMSQLEASWTPAQKNFINLNTGIYGTPKAREYKADQKVLKPYWDLKDQIWDRMQQAYPKLLPYRSSIEYMTAMSQQMKLTGQDPAIIQQRVSQLPIIQYLSRIMGTLRERYRMAHPNTDAILLKWGYTGTLIRQRRR